MKANYLVLAATALILVACGKDEDTPSNNDGGSTAPTCRITKFEATILGQKATVDFTYDASKKLIQQESNSFGDIDGVLYTYNSSGQLVLSKSYENTTAEVYEEFTFVHTNGNLSEYTSYDVDMSNKTYSYAYKATYEAGMIKKTDFFEDENGQTTQTEEVEYAHSAKGVTSKTTYSIDNGQKKPSFRETYTYDDKKADMHFVQTLVEDPFFTSNHNITKIVYEDYDPNTQTWTESDTEIYDYTYNSNNLPETVSLSGIANGTFTYACD